MATITISRAGFRGEQPWSEDVEANIYGVFAVHPSAGAMGDDTAFTLTHIPTGFAYLSYVSKESAEAAAREINASDIDWSAVKSVKDMTAAHKAQGKAMRAKYEHGR